MTDKPEVVCWGSFYKGVIQDFGYNEKATTDNARLDFHGRELTIEPLIRLTDHEAARAADKARIAELMGLLNDAACRMALTGFEPGLCESMFAVLAQQGKEGEK
tara:strand:+ start:68700 stop:69011 length:312 start_codon:yes stop_codon:yes gene_type:complete